MRSIEVIAGIRLRQLSPDERARVFGTKNQVDLTPYLAVVREMEGDAAYAVGLNGTTARATKIRLNKAAKELDLHLRFARMPKDAQELIVELKP